MEVPIIKEIVIIFTLSIAVLMLCHKVGLPGIVGFLVTGVLCGPHGLALVSAIDDVENLATIGVVLLLFTVGMEFSIKSIIKYRYYFFGGGLLQVLMTLLVTMAISFFFVDFPWNQSMLWGFLITLSSTAIVLRVLDERGEGDSSHGKLVVGILIFQDVVAVPMMLMVPILSGTGEEFQMSHVYQFLTGIVLLAVMSFVAFRAVPKLLYYVTKTKNRELFLLSVLTICFAVAWMTSSIGLSLSLGAFLAGLVVSESEYCDEAVGNVLPFQEIFTSFFFVSMGMLLDISFVLKQPFLILGMTLFVLLFKGLITSGSALALKIPLRSAILAGFALCQVGEFSFIIAHSGSTLGLISDYGYQLFLSVSLLTMGLTPTLMGLSHRVANFLNQFSVAQRIGGLAETAISSVEDKGHLDHVIIVGFGLRGQHLARAAKIAELPYVVLELNSDLVKDQRSKGEPIRYGDPSHPSVLQHVGIKKAKTLAVLINDPVATLRIIRAAKVLNPDIYIITRSCYFHEVQHLFHIGADDVIPDEFGSSLEIFTRVLQKFNVSHDKLVDCVNEIRSEGYEALRQYNRAMETSSLFSLDPAEAKIETLRLNEGSRFIGKTIIESELKKIYGLTVLLIKRQQKTITKIESHTPLEMADDIVIMGTPESLTRVKPLFQSA